MNDGSVTYAVHSTSLEAAGLIAEKGFRFARKIIGSSRGRVKVGPRLGRTCIALDGPRSDQVAANVDKLAYRVHNGDQSGEAKVILGFPIPNTTNPHDEYKAFDGTPLGSFGAYVQQLEDGSCYIAPQYVYGHIDNATGKVVHNPAYWETVQRQVQP